MSDYIKQEGITKEIYDSNFIMEKNPLLDSSLSLPTNSTKRPVYAYGRCKSTAHIILKPAEDKTSETQPEYSKTSTRYRSRSDVTFNNLEPQNMNYLSSECGKNTTCCADQMNSSCMGHSVCSCNRFPNCSNYIVPACPHQHGCHQVVPNCCNCNCFHGCSKSLCRSRPCSNDRVRSTDGCMKSGKRSSRSHTRNSRSGHSSRSASRSKHRRETVDVPKSRARPKTIHIDVYCSTSSSDEESRMLVKNRPDTLVAIGSKSKSTKNETFLYKAAPMEDTADSIYQKALRMRRSKNITPSSDKSLTSPNLNRNSRYINEMSAAANYFPFNQPSTSKFNQNRPTTLDLMSKTSESYLLSKGAPQLDDLVFNESDKNLDSHSFSWRGSKFDVDSFYQSSDNNENRTPVTSDVFRRSDMKGWNSDIIDSNDENTTFLNSKDLNYVKSIEEQYAKLSNEYISTDLKQFDESEEMAYLGSVESLSKLSIFDNFSNEELEVMSKSLSHINDKDYAASLKYHPERPVVRITSMTETKKPLKINYGMNDKTMSDSIVTSSGGYDVFSSLPSERSNYTEVSRTSNKQGKLNQLQKPCVTDHIDLDNPPSDLPIVSSSDSSCLEALDNITNLQFSDGFSRDLSSSVNIVPICQTKSACIKSPPSFSKALIGNIGCEDLIDKHSVDAGKGKERITSPPVDIDASRRMATYGSLKSYKKHPLPISVLEFNKTSSVSQLNKSMDPAMFESSANDDKRRFSCNERLFVRPEKFGEEKIVLKRRLLHFGPPRNPFCSCDTCKLCSVSGMKRAFSKSALDLDKYMTQ